MGVKGATKRGASGTQRGTRHGCREKQGCVGQPWRLCVTSVISHDGSGGLNLIFQVRSMKPRKIHSPQTSRPTNTFRDICRHRLSEAYWWDFDAPSDFVALWNSAVGQEPAFGAIHSQEDASSCRSAALAVFPGQCCVWQALCPPQKGQQAT